MHLERAVASKRAAKATRRDAESTLSQLRDSLPVIRASELETRAHKLRIEAEANSHRLQEIVERQADERIANVCGVMERKFEEQTVRLRLRDDWKRCRRARLLKLLLSPKSEMRLMLRKGSSATFMWVGYR